MNHDNARRWRLLGLGCALAAAASSTCAKGLPTPDPTPLVPIAAGTFTLGATVPTGGDCNGSVCSGEYVPHVVTLTRPFKIETTEVTVRQYAAFEAFNTHCKGNANNLNLDQGDQPVQVDIDGARSYCNWQKRRLPTAAEWEVAARLKMDNVTLQRFPWGDAPKTCPEVTAKECHTDSQGIPPVGTSTIDRTPLGIHDMAGSVPEWVEDDYVPGAACDLQTPVSAICGNGDQVCVQRLCASAPQGCAGTCNSSTCGLQPSTGNTFCAVGGKPIVDPLHATFKHSDSICSGNDHGNISFNNPGGSNRAPMLKGGGVMSSLCAQDPAAFSIASNNGGGSNSGQRYGFRCVEGDLPTPRGVVRLQSNGSANFGCTKVTVGLVAGSQAPPGWGTDIRVLLATPQGVVTGTFSKGAYELDPTTLCQGQQNFSGPGANLLLLEVPPAVFDVQIAGQDLNQRCDLVAHALVDTTMGEGSLCKGSNTNLQVTSCTPFANQPPPVCMNANPDCAAAALSYCACCGNNNKAVCGTDACNNAQNIQMACNMDPVCNGNCRNYIIGVDICANFKAMGFCGI